MSEVKRQLEHFRRMSAKMRKSHKWVPLHLFIASDPISGSEVWRNPRYDVRVVRHASGWILDGGPWIRIGISSADGEPRHDWRVFQHIKNQIAGRNGGRWNSTQPKASSSILPTTTFSGRHHHCHLANVSAACSPAQPTQWPRNAAGTRTTNQKKSARASRTGRTKV